MNRNDITEKIITVKVSKGITWDSVAKKVGLSKEWTTAACLGQMTLDEIVGGSPYGATTIAGGQGQRQPSAIELDGARHQGQLIAQTANRLFAH